MFLFQSCKGDNPFTHIDYRLIDSIMVSDIYIKDSRGVLLSGRGIDTLNYSSDDREIIDNVFSLYLNKSRKENFKMFYYYKLTFEYEQKLYSIAVGRNCISYNGITYKLDDDLESYLEKKLKISKRIM